MIYFLIFTESFKGFRLNLNRFYLRDKNLKGFFTAKTFRGFTVFLQKVLNVYWFNVKPTTSFFSS